VTVLLFGHAGRTHAQAKEAGIQSAKLSCQRLQVEEIPLDELHQLGVLLFDRRPGNGYDPLHRWIFQALAQYALTHHTASAEEDHIHQ
jgi:hypothetical protein